MKLSIKVLLTTLIGIVAACSSTPDKLGNLDLKKWRGDRGGCDDARKALEADFKSVEKELKGKFADTIGELLGRPDIQQLGERNIKFYVYFLEKGPQCENMQAKSDSRKVILKFNAVGLLSEITYQDRPL
ncbi:hypothetical protein LZD49_19485 [Dyadobacter sp. CY261]|uniref:hypothetical protein n=1 Tax=Dyadobacter sp. CY261 TaxID=2907203 RepID=UPI001F165458|nr:hypothetical protein [Dyadobacter sp. CY261]MCF0072672.1 hypothetical protein [Dyadobacter sp. CY261]